MQILKKILGIILAFIFYVILVDLYEIIILGKTLSLADWIESPFLLLLSGELIAMSVFFVVIILIVIIFVA